MSQVVLVPVRTFPTDDDAFAAYVAEVHRSAGDDAAALQRGLRRRYPAAVVRLRTDLAAPAGAGPLWYAFRYGAVVPPDDRWWERPGNPTAVIGSDRTFLQASESLAAIVEVPLEVLLGARIETFANADDPGIAGDIAALWERFLVEGELHTTFRFNRLDGTSRELEAHVLRDADAPGRHVAIVREHS